MDHMKFETPDLVQGNIEKIEALFPNCVTEARGEDGKLKKAVNFELLRQMLSGDVVEGDEAYEFTWVGKKAAIVEANKPIRKTLRPCPEESVDWDTTENLYIEGDNLEVLKLLQESYLGKVKLIYIDPPYNTGNDFIYRDDFAMKSDEYEEQLGMFDEETGERLFKNTDSNGRFHSDWCSMIYPRLLLSRNILAPDGVIFISIDDHEADNLKKICDEVFGADCFVANISWQRTYSMRNDAKGIPAEVEHILVYSKNSEWQPKKLARTEEMDSKYKNPDNDPKGDWRNIVASAPNATTHQGMVYSIQNPITGEYCYPPQGRCWSLGQDQMLEAMKQWCDYKLSDLHDDDIRANLCNVSVDEIKKHVKGIVINEELSVAKKKAESIYTNGVLPEFFFSKNGYGTLSRKAYLSEMGGRPVTNLWPFVETGHTDEASRHLKQLFGGAVVFDTPKPVRLMDRIISIASDDRSIILDFFSGSASMAQAIIEKNAHDNGKRKYILVQIPEKTSSPDYTTLCEIGKERIRRAGKKIAEENEAMKNLITLENEEDMSLFADIAKHGSDAIARAAKIFPTSDCSNPNLDIGFRVFKLDDSNMTDVYYSADEYSQGMLAGLESNVKPDRTDLDLLFGCLLEWGLPLSLPYKSEKLEGCTVHTYNDGDLIACFDENVPDSVIKAIARRKPLRAVFRDSSFASSPAKINVEEIFKMLAPDTRVKVI